MGLGRAILLHDTVQHNCLGGARMVGRDKTAGSETRDIYLKMYVCISGHVITE